MCTRNLNWVLFLFIRTFVYNIIIKNVFRVDSLFCFLYNESNVIYIYKKNNISVNKIVKILKTYYRNDFFIKIYKPNTQIGTGSVIKTNNCDISVCQTRQKNKIVIFSSIDNLIKGAAGQAIQNMNILFNLRETSGLK